MIADETSEESADHVRSYGQTPGYTFATLEISNKRREYLKQIFKNFRSSDCYLQLESMKKESLVIANQLCCGEYVLELCTNRPSRSGRCLASSWMCGSIT